MFADKVPCLILQVWAQITANNRVREGDGITRHPQKEMNRRCTSQYRRLLKTSCWTEEAWHITSIQFSFFEILGKAKLTESDRRLISLCRLLGVGGIDCEWVWGNFSGWWKYSVSQKWWCSNGYVHLSELTEQCAENEYILLVCKGCLNKIDFFWKSHLWGGLNAQQCLSSI